MDERKLWAKYLLDKILVAFLAPGAAIILGLAWLLMKLEGSQGPFLLREIRWTQGRPFDFYKVRSQNTRVGALLKKFYLDELPQLAHVAQGYMTLVGPRPVPPQMALHAIEQEGMEAKKILRAGLTGLVQVHKQAARERTVYADLEAEYLHTIKSMSALQIVRYDLSLLSATVPFLLRGEDL